MAALADSESSLLFNESVVLPLVVSLPRCVSITRLELSLEDEVFYSSKWLVLLLARG